MTASETRPLVSVIIPTFNRAKLIGRAIDSVTRQTYTSLEIIVADDASTDDTGQAIATIGDPRLRYLRAERNAGASAARNRGIAAATGAFVAFLDSDDVWMPEKLELQMTAIARYDDPHGVVCFTQVIVDSGASTRLMPVRAIRDKEPVADFMLGDEGLIHTSSLLLSRKLVIDNLFPVGQKKHEDWDLFLRLEQREVEWVFVNQPLVIWHNEPREGRLTNLSHDLSLEWLKAHESRLSIKATRGFMYKEVAVPLIAAERQRMYSLWLVLGAILHGAVAPLEGVRSMARVLVPKRVRDRLRSRARH